MASELLTAAAERAPGAGGVAADRLRPRDPEDRRRDVEIGKRCRELSQRAKRLHRQGGETAPEHLERARLLTGTVVHVGIGPMDRAERVRRRRRVVD